MKRWNGLRRGSRHDRGRRGIALLLTLGILLLLTLLALAFSSSQITESQAARNFYHAARAEEVALGGLETAIAVLRQDANDNALDYYYDRGSGTGEWWSIYYAGDDGFAGRDDPKESEDLSDYDEFEYKVDERGITGGVSPPKDPWKEPIRESRRIEVWVKDPATMEPRKAGRYAVCIEDESAKVNINTAGNPDPEGGVTWKHRQHMGFTTAEIDLGAIFDSLGEMFRGVLDDVSRYPENLSNQTALDVVAWRYGCRGRTDVALMKKLVAGEKGDDTGPMPMNLGQNDNGIDDDGDGLVDEPGEEEDEPGEFDPYDPTEMKAPGQLSSKLSSRTGIMGNDIPYVTVSQIRVAKSVSNSPNFSLMEEEYNAPYPKDRLYRSVLPFVTVYSQDLNRFSSRDIGDSTGAIEWMERENIVDWWDNPQNVKNFLMEDDVNIKYSGDQTRDRAFRQIAANICDFADPDWIPTPYGSDVYGIEPAVYLNEIYPNPPAQDASFLGIEGTVEDWGEWIELWNPYGIALNVEDYYITTDDDSNTMMRIGDMGGPSVVAARSFLLIGDTRGYVRDIGTGGQGSYEKSDLPGRPQGCQAYAPLKLDPPFQDLVLEMRIGGERYPMETHYPNPFSSRNATLQKNDPRVLWDWEVGSPTPGALNQNVPGDVYSHFYFPGVRARAKDPAFDPANRSDLLHAGGLSSTGELGMVHRAEHWQSLNFTGEPQPGQMHTYLDDVKLLDLVTFPYQYSAAGRPPAREFVPGRININTAPPEVLLGLNWDALFDEFSSYGLPASYGLRIGMIDYIVRNRPYRNLADVAKAMANFPLLKNAPEAAREAFLKYNANLITTRSNVFKVTVLAEALDRRGDVAAVRKLEAIVDRGFTPGKGFTGSTPTQEERRKAETPCVLYFRWITED
jgi:hypothetical protein